MKSPRMCVLAIVLLSSILAFSQAWRESNSTQDRHAAPASETQSTTAVSTQSAGDALPFAVDNPKHLKFPVARACHIFEETVREMRFQLNPSHPPEIVLDVVVRLGQQRDFLETDEPSRRTTIAMRKWDDVTFARMVTRAVRNSLFSDRDLDAFAITALRRVAAQVSVKELRER